MSAAHLHLLLNHIPILGTLFGLVLLFYALVGKSDEIKKASFGSFIVTALITIPAFGSGLGAAPIVERLPDVSKTIIERHQQAALITLVAIEILGAVALLSLWLARRSPNARRWMVFVVLALAVISGGLGMWTGSLGGEIRHTEVRTISLGKRRLRMTRNARAHLVGHKENRQLHWPALLLSMLMLFASSSLAQTAPPSQPPPTPPPSSSRPQYKQLRYDEDWSSLLDPARGTEALDRIKYIPLDVSRGWYLSIGGDVRGHYESFRNPSWGQEPQDGFFLQRYMLHADLHMGNRVRIFFQIKSGLENGREGGPRPIDEDRLDIGQAFVDTAFRFGTRNTLILRVGRQEMLFGSGRLVGVRDGPNVRLSFDGLSAIMRVGSWRVDGFVTKPVETNPGLFDDAQDHARTFWGMYAARPFQVLPHGNVDLYYLGIDRKRAHFDQGTAREVRHSVGMRLWGQARAWDYNSELVLQLGSFGRGNVRAWAVASDLGYTLRQARFGPRLGLKAHIASGDRDGSDHNLETFNALFPRGEYFGEMGLIGLANLMDIHPSLDLRLTERVTVRGDWDVFWRKSLRDGIYGNGINLLRSGRTNRAHYIGSQPSLWMEWEANRHITFTASYSRFFAGPFLRETSPGRNISYLTARATYKF